MQGCLTHCRWPRVQLLWKTIQRSLIKLDIHLPYKPAILLPRCLPKWTENLHSHKVRMCMLTAILFIKTPNQKQSKHPSTGKGINKLWYIQMMEHYSVIKGSKIMKHETTWINLKCTGAKKPDPKSYIPYASIYIFLQRQNFRDKNKTKQNRSKGCQGLEVKRNDWLQRTQRKFADNRTILHLDWSCGYITVYIWHKCTC